MSDNSKHGCSFIGNVDSASGDCCEAHDHEYAKGEFIAKFLADFALLFCLIRSYKHSDSVIMDTINFVLRFFLALIMFLAVFTVGWIWWMRYFLRRISGGKWFPKQDN